MTNKEINLPLRSGVGIIVLNKKNEVFIAKRIDNQKNFWQMPQGGVDKGEDYLAAAYRELEEETSIKNVDLIKELDGLTSYELPKSLLGVIWKGKYRGQEQKWFVMKFLGQDSEINIKDIEKTKISELLTQAEELSKNTEITDQNKYLVDQKIDVLKTLN